MLTTIFAADSVNLEAGWADVWGAVKSTLGPIERIMTGLGVIIVVVAIGKFFWDKRRGGGGGMGGGGATAIGWAIALGSLLAAPGLIFPIFLRIVDAIANSAVGFFQG